MGETQRIRRLVSGTEKDGDRLARAATELGWTVVGRELDEFGRQVVLADAPWDAYPDNWDAKYQELTAAPIPDEPAEIPFDGYHALDADEVASTLGYLGRGKPDPAVRFTVREFDDVRWAVVDGLHPVASGMTEEDAHRVAVFFNQAGRDTDVFISKLTPEEREAVKERVIRRALEVGKQIGARDGRNAIADWLDGEPKHDLAGGIAVDIRNEEYKPSS